MKREALLQDSQVHSGFARNWPNPAALKLLPSPRRSGLISSSSKAPLHEHAGKAKNSSTTRRNSLQRSMLWRLTRVSSFKALRGQARQYLLLRQLEEGMRRSAEYSCSAIIA